MQSVSPEFLDAIKSPTRVIDARLRIDFTDLYQDATADGSSTQNARISWPDQLANARLDMTHKWASLDGSTVPNNTYYPAPSTVGETGPNEFGWWADSLADGSGVTNKTAETTFSKRSVGSITVAFDNKRGEYGVDFTAKLYDDSILVHTLTITGNASTTVTSSFALVSDINKVVLNVTKWSHPGRQVKVAELSTGLVVSYGPDSLQDFSVIQDRDISNTNTLPVGNFSAGEINASIINVNRQFDAMNTSSPIYGRVRPNARVNPQIGVWTGTEFEYVSFGSYWVRDWQVPEQDLTVTLSAQDLISLLGGSTYSDSTIQFDKTIYQLLVKVLEDAGLASTQYDIDSTLDTADYIIPVSFFDAVSHREAMEQLAAAGAAVIYTSPNGKVTIRGVDWFDSNNLVPDDSFDRSEYMEKQAPSDYNNLANTVRIPIVNFQEEIGVNLYTSSEDEVIEASTSTEYTILFSDKPTYNQVAVISPAVSGLTITVQTWYAWGGVVTVQNTNASQKTFRLSVTGDKYVKTGGKFYTASDSQSIQDNGPATFTLPENDFIQSRALAEKIGDALLVNYKDALRDLELSFSPGGNPALELGDRIEVTDRYTTEEYHIIGQELAYNGGLNIKLKGRKA